ncbi:amidohydrolase [Kitasatospora sp. NPDC049285]|uniref:amidohydrolase n=1 Tax=Kitasatospora sp. NPDC049285 TaxID=3157096 RepID=UPI00343F0D33
MHPDLVLLNARLLDPGTGAFLPFGALAASGGRITRLGEERELRALAGPGTTVVDLRGAVVTPGLTDGHLHPVSGAERTTGVDLSACADLAEVRAVLAAAVRELTPGQWLRGWGLDPNAFGGQPVAADSLAPVLDGVPTAIDLFDAHSMLVSHRALELAGIDGPRRFAQGSAEVVCDAAGRPTGLLLEDAACELVEAVAPKVGFAELCAQSEAVLRRMAAAGLTGGHAMDANGESLAVYAALEERGELPLRLRIAPWCQPGTDDEALAELIRRQGEGGRNWRVTGVKLFMDGTIDNGTAWLEHPDCHGESTGAFWPDPAAYSRVVAELHRGKVPTATHAIGDAAVRHALDAVEQAAAAHGAGVRHRIEHIETVPDDTVGRFAALGVTASMQPTHCTEYTRADHTDNWSRRLGEERANRAFRCRDLWEAGARVVLGSDWPIAPFAPLGVMAGARHRRPSRHLDQPPHLPEQALTPLQALQGYTVNPAWTAGEEDRAGRIALGYRADLTAFAEDPLAVGDTSLAELPVVLTVSGGRITHRTAD